MTLADVASLIEAHADAWKAQLAASQERVRELGAREAGFPWFLLQESATFLRNDKDLAGDMDARNLAYRLELALAASEPLGEEQG